MNLKLIIFDWDDVISIGSKEAYYSCYREAASSVGVSIDIEELQTRINRKWGRPHRQEVAELLKEHPHLVEKAEKVYESCIFTETFSRHLALIPGVKNLLVELSKKYKLAIATGINPELLKIIMEKFDINPTLFTQIITSYDLADKERGKPYPDMALTILKTQNIEPEEVVVVGDAEGDVKMAMSAGITPIVVLTGRLTEEKAQELGVKYIINNVTNLPVVLKHII